MALAAEWAGFRCIGHSEVEPYCCRLLEERFPGEPNFGDVREFEQWPDFGHVSLIAGGPPCQPFSIAGRKLGAQDHRDLWPSMLGVIRRYRPDWCLIENVVNVANMVLASWQDDLALAGYQSQGFDIPSCAVGLPSLERHIWLVAAANVQRLPRYSTNGFPWVGLAERGEARQPFEWWAPKNGGAGKGIGWQAPQPALLRSRKGTPNFVDRIRAIGNAVPPPVAFQILKAIRQQIGEQPVSTKEQL